MKVSTSKPGIVVSALVHTSALMMALVSFSETKPFADAQESVPVEIITDSQLNEIMRGEKDAKQQPTPATRADKQAEEEERRPKPVVEAKRDIPTPPQPAKRMPDPGESDEKEPAPPQPAQRMAAVQPEPAKPVAKPIEPPKTETKPEPPKPDAEAIEPPKPPVRPKEEPKKAEPTPLPPTRVRPLAKEEPKPKTEQLDRAALAKLLEKVPEPPKPAAKPKSGEENAQRTRFDAATVSSLLSKEAPGGRAATARNPSQQAALGTATANAAKMSPSLQGQLDGLMQEQYRQCWSYVGLTTTRYVPQVKVEFAADGSLSAQPVLLNPPGDANLNTLSESALRAVRRCNPLKIPAQFVPYYDQWKSRILRFDPEEMAG